MNYYIQGNPANAEQIKAAFEAKGFNTLGINFENKTLLYFSFEGCIKHCSDDWFFTHLIKTHPDYKELELPVEPKFKVGDSLQSGSTWARIRRIDTEKRWYICDFDNVIPFEEQDSWSLVPNPKPHYDTKNFKPFDKVLVRDEDDYTWKGDIFLYHTEAHKEYPFVCVADCHVMCIPFNDDTKHLLGTTDMCDGCYINW